MPPFNLSTSTCTSTTNGDHVGRNASRNGPAVADAAGSGGAFKPLTYSRLFDSATQGAIAADGQTDIQVAGRFGVPTTGVGAVLVDLAATSSTTSSSGMAWLFPKGSARPSAPALRFGTETVPRSNTVAVPLGQDGSLTLVNSLGSTRFNLDIQGYFTSVGSSGPEAGGLMPLSPKRILDTASGTGVAQGRLAAGQTVTVAIGGANGIPVGAQSIFASVEVSNIAEDGSMRLRAAGSTTMLNPNFEYSVGGQERSGLLIPLASDGRVEIRNMGSRPADIRIDVQGYFEGGASAGGGFTASSQTNLVDTETTSRLQPDETRSFDVGSVAGVPKYGAAGAMLMVSSWSAAETGGIELWRTGTGGPSGLASLMLNSNDPNPATATTVIRPGNNGQISIRNNSAAR